MRYDLRGHTWNKVRRKSGKKPSKSTDPCQRTETVGIGLTPSSLTRAFKASSAGRVARPYDKRTDKRRSFEGGPSEAEGEGGPDTTDRAAAFNSAYEEAAMWAVKAATA